MTTAANGMNRPKDRLKRFDTVSQAFTQDAGYWGDCEDWYIVAAQNRDSAIIDKANFQTLLDLLGGEGEYVTIERANHWACGWVEYLCVHPTNWQGLRIAINAHCALADYPILDEEKYSELEEEDRQETWDNCIKGDFCRLVEKTLLGDNTPTYLEVTAKDETIARVFNEAADRTSEYWQTGSSGAWIKIDPVAAELTLEELAELAGLPIETRAEQFQTLRELGVSAWIIGKIDYEGQGMLFEGIKPITPARILGENAMKLLAL